MITINSNIPQFNAKFSARSQVLTANLIVAINSLSLELQNRILSRSGSPASNAHRRKGWLANSVRPVPAVASGSEVSGGVLGGGGDAWYGSLFEYGTSRAYPIIASHAKALYFEMHGQQVFLKKVMHPGFDSSRLAFMRPPFMEMQEQIVAEIQAAAMEAFQ